MLTLVEFILYVLFFFSFLFYLFFFGMTVWRCVTINRTTTTTTTTPVATMTTTKKRHKRKNKQTKMYDSDKSSKSVEKTMDVQRDEWRAKNRRQTPPKVKAMRDIATCFWLGFSAAVALESRILINVIHAMLLERLLIHMMRIWVLCVRGREREWMNFRHLIQKYRSACERHAWPHLDTSLVCQTCTHMNLCVFWILLLAVLFTKCTALNMFSTKCLVWKD